MQDDKLRTRPLGNWQTETRTTAEELEAISAVSALLSAGEAPTARRGAATAAEHSLMATRVDWWLRDSHWWEWRDMRGQPRVAWCLMPLDQPERVVGWLVPQAAGLVALVPAASGALRSGTGQAGGGPATSAPSSGAGFAQVMGTGRGFADQELNDLRKLSAWLSEHDHDHEARQAQVRGAGDFGFKAQCARVHTYLDELGFAYEVYPAGQRQRRNLRALVVIAGDRTELYRRA